MLARGMREWEMLDWIVFSVIGCIVSGFIGLATADAAAARDKKVAASSFATNMGEFVTAFENPQEPNVRFKSKDECAKTTHAWITYDAVSWQTPPAVATVKLKRKSVALYQRVTCGWVKSKNENRLTVTVCDCKLAL